MDIAKMSIYLNQALVQQQASLSVMKMTMDTGKVQASDMVEMLEASMPEIAHPQLGGKIDLRA